MVIVVSLPWLFVDKMISRRNSARVLAALAVIASSEAFVPFGLVNRLARTSTNTWKAATIDDIAISGAKDLTTWECDEDAQCVEVPACDEETCRTSLDVRIHGEWYDLTGLSSSILF